MDSEEQSQELTDKQLDQVSGGEQIQYEACPKCGYNPRYYTEVRANDGKHRWIVTFKCYRCDYEAVSYR